MKAYKGFNNDMTCRGFQYKEGETYETDKASLCESGFHACEAPIDCLRYYEPAKSVYHEVDLDATDEKSNEDSKRVGRRIKIGARIDIVGMIKAQFEYVKENCTNNKMGGNRSALNGGDWSALNGGDLSALNGGDWSALNGGDRSALNGGNRSALNGGDWSVMRGCHGSKFKGGMWAVFACEIIDNNYTVIGMKVAVVDGDKIKPDIWYTLKDGDFAEVDE